jgi:hypothetical protein
VTLVGGVVARLVGLDELPATEPATGSGGFGYANDSEGEKGKTDMGVVATWLIEKLVIWSRKRRCCAFMIWIRFRT